MFSHAVVAGVIIHRRFDRVAVHNIKAPRMINKLVNVLLFGIHFFPHFFCKDILLRTKFYVTIRKSIGRSNPRNWVGKGWHSVSRMKCSWTWMNWSKDMLALLRHVFLFLSIITIKFGFGNGNVMQCYINICDRMWVCVIVTFSVSIQSSIYAFSDLLQIFWFP